MMHQPRLEHKVSGKRCYGKGGEVRRQSPSFALLALATKLTIDQPGMQGIGRGSCGRAATAEQRGYGNVLETKQLLN